MSARSSLFDSTFLEKAERLRIIGRRQVESVFYGLRPGTRTGTGQEFVDRRNYVTGDDFRHIDWGVFARHGDLLIKRFHEEGDLPVHILVDCSQSMTCGQPRKFDLARQLAGSLAYIALSSLDRVSITGFTDQVGQAIPLARGPGQFAVLLDFLEKLSPSDGRSDLAAALPGMLRKNPAQGVIIVISDLFFAHDFQVSMEQLVHQRLEPHVIQIYSAEEAHPHFSGAIDLVDVESGTKRTVTVNERICRIYHGAFEEFLQSIRATAQRYRICLAQTRSDCPFEMVILEMMREAGSLRV